MVITTRICFGQGASATDTVIVSRSRPADGSKSQMIIKEEFADIATPTGPMRLHLFRPAAAGRYPGILLYSEIYQITGPIRRMAAFLAGQGYLVGAPEVYHECEPLGIPPA
jgi:hypothetical protein